MLLAKGKAAPYALRVVARDGGANIALSAGLSIMADALPEADCAVDTLLGSGGPGVDAAIGDAGLVDWLRQHAGSARRTPPAPSNGCGSRPPGCSSPTPSGP